MVIKHTINFLSHHSSVAIIVPLVASHPNPVSLSFNLFQATQSFFNVSHLCLNFILGYSLLVFFLKFASIFLQPGLLKWVMGQLPLNTSSTQASQKIVICFGVHRVLKFELFCDGLGLGFKVSFCLLIYIKNNQEQLMLKDQANILFHIYVK
jgi:hypothetical protein